MTQRSRRLRLTEWADLVDAEVPERALENPTLKTVSDRQPADQRVDEVQESRGSRRGKDGRDLHH